MKKNVSYIPYLGNTLNNKPFEYKESWEFKLKTKLENENSAINTNDIVPINQATDIVFFDNYYYRNMGNITQLYKQKKLHKTVYIDYEPPTGHCRNHSNEGIKMLSQIFKCVITYNDDLVDNKKIFKGCIANFFTEEQPYKKDFKKRKLIALITNNITTDRIIRELNIYNCSTYYNHNNFKKHNNQIYDQREIAASFFTENHPEEFDLYGNNWSNKFKKTLKGPVDRNKKLETINKYKFIISYDSYTNQNGYISEKIFDVFKGKSIPIYWGADNVSDYIPTDCYIDKRSFQTYEELYEYLTNMTEEEYNKKIRAIENFLDSDDYKKYFSSEVSAKVVYDCLNLDSKNFSYKNALKNLKKLKKEEAKVKKESIINFCASMMSQEAKTKNVEITFACNEFDLTTNIEYIIEINNQKINPTNIVKNINKEEGSINIIITVNFKVNSIKTKVKVYKKIDNNSKIKINLNDLSHEYNDHQVGELALNKKEYIINVKKK